MILLYIALSIILSMFFILWVTYRVLRKTHKIVHTCIHVSVFSLTTKEIIDLINELHNDGLLDTSDLINIELELYDIDFIAFLLYLCYSLDESFKNSLDNYLNKELYII